MRRRGRFRRVKRVEGAGDVIARVIDHYGIGGDLKERRVLTEWRELVGERIAARTWPGRIKDGMLPIRVSNSAWMHELSFLRDQLLARLRERTEGLVQDIRFYAGKPRRAWRSDLARANHARRKPAPEPPPVVLTPARGADLVRIEHETANVEDDELRDIIREARRRLNL